MLYLQYKLHKSWGEPYKWAPQGIKNRNFDQKWPRKLISCWNNPKYWYLTSQVPIYRVTPNFYAIDIEEMGSRLILTVFCGYYVLSNSPNWKNFNIITTFGVIFGQNLGIWPPGVTIYRVPLNCYAVDYKDIASRFNRNVFLWLLCAI